MAGDGKKSIGQAIDAVIEALKILDESSRRIVVRAACEHLNIPMDSTGSLGSTTSSVRGREAERQNAVSLDATTSSGKVVDIRSLKESKNPRTTNEMACVIAYYLENCAVGDERKNEITTEDITKYCKHGGFPLPKVPTQVLPNAKAAGYFDSKGGGKYKLNPVGYNLVAHTLPRVTRKK